MKFILLLLLLTSLALTSCSSSSNKRYLSSNEIDLSGTLLGVATYKTKFIKKVNPKRTGRRESIREKHRATRIYLNPIKEEPGSYYAVLLEYVNLLKMAPKYIASNKLPRISKIIGFLNEITKKITVYKVMPTNDERKYEMQKVNIVGDELVSADHDDPSYLVLSGDSLEGSKITAGKGGEIVDVRFPSSKDKRSNGIQYALANFVYKKVKLESTWRDNFLPGPYLGAYGDKEDEVLKLKSFGDGGNAEFKINQNRTHLRPKKRENQFTNPKSAYIEGKYNVKKLTDGIFKFESIEVDQLGQSYVEGKMGLFIDIFDARKALNQDVVELVLVNSNQPEDFLMYYEHPDNGEGK